MLKKRNRILTYASVRRTLLLVFALVPLALATVVAQNVKPPPKTEQVKEVSAANKACLECHDPAAEVGPAMHIASLQNSTHKGFDCTDCHSSFTAESPHSAKMLSEKVACGDCHSKEADTFAASVHGQMTTVALDAPTCLTCHTDNKDVHAVKQPKAGTRGDLVTMCSTCHSDPVRMARNHVDVDAVSSYEASFHGKALLRFGKQQTAICTDCHTAHGVLRPADPKSTVSSGQLPKTCGQAGCHVGATMNFANSGFSHLHIKVKGEPILGATELFFKVLTFGTLAMLLLGIAFDIRVVLFGPKKPNVSRTVAVLIGSSFLFIVGSIALAVLNNPLGFYSTVIAVTLATVGAMAHVVTKRAKPKVAAGRTYPRFSVSQRIQHLLLMLSFTTLVVTGMPIRYPKNDVLRDLYNGMGGIDVMRLVHRIAAVVLISLWVYHTGELVVRWKRAGYTFESWTMFPRRRDLSDLFATVRYHLGMIKEPPSYDRFMFREKFDYLAVYWGMPIMVVSGLILWYPVYLSRYLPALGIPLAYIAHSDEAVLAFLTIVTWHIYNTHFRPPNFPMNTTFITGTLSEEAMRHEHGDELARICAEEAVDRAQDGSKTNDPGNKDPEDSHKPDLNE